MADEHLRALERAASGGDVEAESKLLLRRVRAGDLTEERLRLAAYLGHEAAVLATGDDAPEIPADMQNWLKGLHLWGKHVAVMAVVVVARRMQGTLGWDLHEATQIAEGWLRDPESAPVPNESETLSRDSFEWRVARVVTARGPLSAAMAAATVASLATDHLGESAVKGEVRNRLSQWALDTEAQQDPAQ